MTKAYIIRFDKERISLKGTTFVYQTKVVPFIERAGFTLKGINFESLHLFYQKQKPPKMDGFRFCLKHTKRTKMEVEKVICTDPVLH